MATKSATSKATTVAEETPENNENPKETYEKKVAKRQLRTNILNKKDELRELIKSLLESHKSEEVELNTKQLENLVKVNEAIKEALAVSSEIPASK
jgi:formate dehydrogenase maturation protein FdhE